MPCPRCCCLYSWFYFLESLRRYVETFHFNAFSTLFEIAELSFYSHIVLNRFLLFVFVVVVTVILCGKCPRCYYFNRFFRFKFLSFLENFAFCTFYLFIWFILFSYYLHLLLVLIFFYYYLIFPFLVIIFLCILDCTFYYFLCGCGRGWRVIGILFVGEFQDWNDNGEWVNEEKN